MRVRTLITERVRWGVGRRRWIMHTTDRAIRIGEDLLTPDEAAKRLKVTAEQVRSLIRKGQLAAINVGTGPKRPLYRITSQALHDFLAQRWRPGPVVRRLAKRPPPVPDHFPDLR